MPTARYRPGTVYYEGEVFAVSGTTSTALTTANEKYRVDTDAWTSSSRAPVGTHGAAFDVVSATGQCISSAGSVSKTHKYSINTDFWTTVTSNPSAWDSVTGHVIGSEFFVVGGWSTTHKKTVHKFDISADTWTTGTAMPTARNQFSLGVFASFLAAFGGVAGGPVTNAAEVYDVEADTWELATPMPAADNAMGAALFDGLFYSMRGTGVLFAYRFAAAASIQGDPLFTTFSGSSDHLALREGIFTLFASPALTVTVMVATLATLAPEENQVVVAASIASTSSTSLYCSTSEQGCFLSHAHIGSVTDKALRANLGDCLVSIFFQNMTVIATDGAGFHTRVYNPSEFLDIHLHCRGLRDSAQGLLADADRSGFPYVRQMLAGGAYTAHDLFLT